MRIPIALGQHALAMKKHSPNALFGLGVVGMVGSTVLACRGTLRLETVLERSKEDLDTARSMRHEEYTDQDRKKDITVIYVRAIVNVTRLYGPSVVLGFASIAALTKSHNMLNDRIAGLSAAYTALEQGYNAYRQRVIEKYGEDVDHQMRFPREKSRQINEETGREHSVELIRADGPSIYARFFDQTSSEWGKEAEYNLIFLKCQQNYVNDLLKARGHVFLNEVYDRLGIERSRQGAVVGWVLGTSGDNFIDFGLYNADGSTRQFINGQEGAVLLDFNVDGLIYDKLGDEHQEALSWQKGE